MASDDDDVDEAAFPVNLALPPLTLPPAPFPPALVADAGLVEHASGWRRKFGDMLCSCIGSDRVYKNDM